VTSALACVIMKDGRGGDGRVLEYGLLGPIEVRVDDRAVELASANQRLVLAMLLLGANQPVPADRLVDELWGEALPRDPPAALRTQISRLRRALGPAAGGLVAVGGGYRLSLRRRQLDTARFEDALAAAPHAAGEPGLRILDEALGLWRGPALAEFADRPFAQPEAVRLDELRAAARERRAELMLSMGSAEDAVAALQAVVAEHPERERARGLLMQALYQEGRHTDALATFRSWRHYLSEDLGLDPSPALERIEQDILRHAIPLAESVPLPVRRALPLPVTSFIGRDADRRAVTDLLGQVRLLTLHGPGGVGKTRLALEVLSRIGARYRDGICFCDLAAIARPAAVTRAIATAAALEERAFQRLDDQLVEALAARQLLLVLDNCEHVADGIAVIAHRLLRETRNITVLVTSRERLEVDGEHVWPVRPLPAGGPGAPAVRLFLDRARAADPGAGQETGDAEAIADLCAGLDGLPLAIELAAARVPGTTIGELADSLQDRFRLLTAGHHADSRHRSLRAVLDWSYQLLTTAEQRLFDELSVFRGWFDIGAARAVTVENDDGTDVARLVLHLVDRSLITADRDGGVARYRLLETLRVYGLERLEKRGELDAARGRHARWAVELVTRAARGLCGSGEAGWAARLDSHIGDLRAAHSWLTGHDTELSLRMCAELHWYALWRCQSEVFRWADVAAAAAAGSRLAFYPQALATAAFGAVYRGDLQAADTSAHAALEAAQGLAPIAGRRALQALGDIAIYRGDLKRAADLYLQAYELSVEAGDWLDAAWDAASASVALANGNHLAEASHLASRGRDAAARSGAPSALAVVSWVLGEITAATDPGQAGQHLRRAVELAEPVGCRLVAALAQVSLATLHARHGEPAAALRYYNQVITQWRQAGAWTPQWITVRTLIDLLARLGACQDAATLYGAAASASSGAPPYGADADRLRQTAALLRDQLTDAEFRCCTDRGGQLDGAQAIDLALEAIARAAAKPGVHRA
jgi:predicted ATPase/DNA-binding SARP family transcriptional activator